MGNYAQLIPGIDGTSTEDELLIDHTVRQEVQRGARLHPKRSAVIEVGGRSTDYDTLDARVTALAHGFAELGVRRGTRIATLMRDCLEYIETYLAAAELGAIVVPINTLLTVAEARVIIDDAAPAVLVWTAEQVRPALALLMPGVHGVAVAHTPPGNHVLADYDELLEKGHSRPPLTRRIEMDDPYIIGYTSGTTGRPKGAVMTHRSVTAIARSNATAYRLPPESIAVLTGSMSFVSTVPAHILTHLNIGGTVVIPGSWTVKSLISLIERFQATFTYIPSPRAEEFARAVLSEPGRTRSLRSVLHSASAIGPHILELLHQAVGDALVEGLGMTENSGGLITATRPGDFHSDSAADNPFRSVGRAVPGSDVAILDENGHRLPQDGQAVGEIVFRSAALMSGYWKMHESTESALRDGWYHSGDLGSMDSAGFVYVSDRRTDLIVSGGMNVYPTEVENAIATHPAVVECAVVGAPHRKWGMTVVAVAVLADGASLDLAELQTHCKKLLASYKKPTQLLLVDELPRTASLKIKRNMLRNRLVREGSISSPSKQ